MGGRGFRRAERHILRAERLNAFKYESLLDGNRNMMLQSQASDPVTMAQDRMRVLLRNIMVPFET
jgi:hypothetical protein